ncbi:MAG: helix-turn-helix domain-containing protein [Gemmataceae bacterium]|nr:helix-turn-helix domain-containing protein [Gemmataceae bacterium]
MMMSSGERRANRVRQYRLDRRLSQAELAQRINISRAAISAIEQMRLVPSVATALALAGAFGCTVEALFGGDVEGQEPEWAGPLPRSACRFWQALVGHRVVRYSAADASSFGAAHDGVFQGGEFRLRARYEPERTLVVASCDPASSLLAAEYARTTCFRLLVLSRSSGQALSLLGNGAVHCAGLHYATEATPEENDRAVAAELGAGFRLLHVAQWQEGLALASGSGVKSVGRAVNSRSLRWVGREPGSAARRCLDELRGPRPAPRRIVHGHRGTADAVRNGWADVGVCHRLVAEEAGLAFLPVRKERFELCFPATAEGDPRIEALVRLLRSPECRQLFDELPGIDTRHSGSVRNAH